MPATSPYLECYEAGAMLNQLNFAMQQAYLLINRDQYDASDRLMAELIGRSHDSIASLISNIRDEWRIAWGSESHSDELRDAHKALEYEDLLSSGEMCQRLVDANTAPFIQEIKAALRPVDDISITGSIFDLGDTIDQIVRRADVCRFLTDLGSEGECSDDGGDLPLGDWEPGAPRTPVNLVADTLCMPGAQPPDSATLVKIRRLWTELPFETDFPEKAIKSLSDSFGTESAKQAHGVIDRAARAAIRRFWALSTNAAEPIWNSDSRVLRSGSFIKDFGPRAVNQMTILSAFEDDGWPQRIDDPLPPKKDKVSKRVLNDTISDLNTSVQESLLNFYADGTGEGVCWKLKQPE